MLSDNYFVPHLQMAAATLSLQLVYIMEAADEYVVNWIFIDTHRMSFYTFSFYWDIRLQIHHFQAYSTIYWILLLWISQFDLVSNYSLICNSWENM